MMKLVFAVMATLALSTAALAGTSSSHDFKTLAPKVFKSPKATSSLQNQKDDLAIVYGGEDVSRSITDDSYTA